MTLIIVLVFLEQILSLLIFKPLTEIVNYFVQINFLLIILISSFVFLISRNSHSNQ